jgi:hypothetical protein
MQTEAPQTNITILPATNRTAFDATPQTLHIVSRPKPGLLYMQRLAAGAKDPYEPGTQRPRAYLRSVPSAAAAEATSIEETEELIARAMSNMEVNTQDEVPDILPSDPEEDADLDIPTSGQKKSQPLYDNTGSECFT